MPVDVASGAVALQFEDVSVPGAIDLVFDRRYSTELTDWSKTPLGHGWTCRYFSKLVHKADGLEFVTPKGAVELLPDPEGQVHRGERAINFGAFLEVFREGHRYIVQHWDIGSGEVWRYCFNAGPLNSPLRLSSIEDVTGRAIDLAWDDAGQLTSIRQRLEKRTLTLSYTKSGFIESVAVLTASGDQHPKARYEYDLTGRLVAAFDAANNADRFEYDQDDRLVREINKDGGVFSYRYDSKGRCIRSSGLDRYDEKTLSFLDATHWTEVRDSLGHVTRYEWLPSGQIVTEVDPLGGISKTEYDTHGRIVTTIGPDGGVTNYQYDHQGNRSAVTDAAKQISKTEYNLVHLPLSYTDRADNTWHLRYNESNRLIATVDPEGNSFGLSYDEEGNLASILGPMGKVQHVHFSSQGVLQSVTDWEGHVTRYELDGLGRLVWVVDPLNYHTQFWYDEVNNLKRIGYPDGSSEEFDYDPGRNLTRVIDRNKQVTRYKFGSCGRLAQRIDPLNKITYFTWDTEPDLLKRVTNAKGDSYHLEHNAIGKISREIGFDGRETRFDYDPAGRRIARINGLGERIGYQRDSLGRVVKQELPDGTETSFSYDGAGFVSQAANADCEIFFQRDRMGRVVQERINGHLIERRYDANGNTQQIKSGSGAIEYQLDGNRQLVGFRVDGSEAIECVRDPRGRETRCVFPGGITHEQQYDSMARLKEQVVVGPSAGRGQSGHNSGNILVKRSYGNSRGQLTSVNDRYWGETTYVYDQAERLVKAIRKDAASETFLFDENDNIIRIERGERAEALSYSAGDRIDRQNNIDYQFDAQGRLVRKSEKLPNGDSSQWEYQWDAFDRLRTTTNPDGGTWSYSYDPFGRRIEKRFPDGRRHGFLWDKDVVLHELVDGKASSTWVCDPENFRPICKRERDDLYLIISDHIGTPRELTDRFGQVVWRADYWSWGGVREKTASAVDCPVRFQGQWWDEESGLHYNRFRYYEPNIGRYLSADPIRLMGGLNLYTYVRNPILWIDPFGLVINTTADRTHITYVGTKGGETYVGYASMPGNQTGEDVLAYRYSGGFSKEGLDGTPEVMYRGYGDTLAASRDAKATARGLEQRGFEFGGGLEGTSNAQNPVGKNSDNRKAYLDAADAYLKKKQDEEEEKQKAKAACGKGSG